ncbi:hypothetical protein FH972_005505 [Carpinus fangiana]|uniref:Protein kinase domain-containing protein n=1 Tax=Carpinus fangiana TaxID=176857 RepID=A0A5N6QRA6_9ROSI|nr:hypothetical protein FH972_005505 [Carpinus fangiana]
MKQVAFLLLFSLCFLSVTSAAPAPPPPTCPMDLNYVLRIPWNTSLCKQFQPTPTSQYETNRTSCCQSLLSLLGVALAQHLKETSLFQLPDLPTSTSCLQDFQSKLTALSLASNIVSSCFNPLQFVISSNICAQIQTTQDWVSKLGPSTALDSGCWADLTVLSSCDACVSAGLQVQRDLISIDGNSSQAKALDCFYFAIIYAAGIVNKLGPESDGAVSCIFGLSLNSQVDSSSKGHSGLIFGLTGAGVAILVMSCLLGFYFWFDRSWRRKKKNALGGNLGNGYDLEELGSSRPRVRPNTGSIWFKIEELEKATDNFSQRNFIGRGGFGLVYKGVLRDETVVAVKKVIESEIQGDVEFCNEVEIISNLKHRNLVPLRGCCVVDGDEEYDERRNQRYLVYDYMPNGNLENHLFPSADGGMGKKLLTWPQRKSIILDVAKGKALDLSSGSPQAFLITDWAWSLVKAGKVEQAFDASLLKDGGDSVNSNPKSIMERFVLVGILCAHVMVALRPTIIDTLRMLEGDIEVPSIPDRPMPLAHPSFYGNGNAFSKSPALSGPKLHSGDMLR